MSESFGTLLSLTNTFAEETITLNKTFVTSSFDEKFYYQNKMQICFVPIKFYLVLILIFSHLLLGVDHRSTRSRHLSVANSSGVSSIGSHSLSQHMNFSTFGRGSPSEGLSTFPRNAGTKNVLNVSRHPSSSSVNQSCKVHRLHSEHYSPQRKPLRDIPSVPRSFTGDRLHRAQNQSLVRYDDSYCESCNTTARDDDDATTTSGSYTINPDDLCNDIDNLFFKSDTVV